MADAVELKAAPPMAARGKRERPPSGSICAPDSEHIGYTGKEKRTLLLLPSHRRKKRGGKKERKREWFH